LHGFKGHLGGRLAVDHESLGGVSKRIQAEEGRSVYCFEVVKIALSIGDEQGLPGDVRLKNWSVGFVNVVYFVTFGGGVAWCGVSMRK